MRLSRHASNRLRLIGRRYPEIDRATLGWSIPSGELLGYDDAGHRRVRVHVASAAIVVIVDEADDVIITMWIEGQR